MKSCGRGVSKKSAENMSEWQNRQTERKPKVPFGFAGRGLKRKENVHRGKATGIFCYGKVKQGHVNQFTK